MQPTKIPARRVTCDEFVVTVDEVEYRPHAGEWVEFRGKASVQSYLRLLRLNEIQAMPREKLAQKTSEEIGEMYAELQRATEENLDLLTAAIIGWNWTGEYGEPLPTPPTVADLGRLSNEEVGFLTLAFRGQVEQNTDARKNGSSPSTNRSTRRKADRSRKSG